MTPTKVTKFKSSGRRHDEAPDVVRYFVIDAAGDEQQDGTSRRVHHVGAADEAEAREVVEELEKRNAKHYGTSTWEIVSVLEGDANVPHPEDLRVD